MIEDRVQMFPKLIFSLEIKSLILSCEGSIHIKKCDSGIPGMKVIDYGKERSGDSKTHASLRIISGSGEI